MSCPQPSKKRKSSAVADVLTYVEGQAQDIPKGQKQMWICFTNQEPFGTNVQTYRQFKISFAECSGWDELTSEIANRDCLSVVGFDDS